jgi:hypothetical protein
MALLLYVTVPMGFLGVYLVISAFEKTLRYGYTHTVMTPSAAMFSRVVRFVVGLFFLGLGCRYALQLFR